MKGLAAVALLVIAANPTFAEGSKASTMHYMKALMLEHQGTLVEALQEYQAAIALDPQSSFLLEQAAQTALEAGRPDAALELATKLVKLDPQSPKAESLLGNVLAAKGDVEGAQKAFEEALKLNPKFADAMLSLGNLLSAQSPDNARKYLDRYIAANPENAAEAHYQLALLEQKAGNLDRAVERLKAALALNPDAFQAHLSLAQLYEARRDTEAALTEYRAILERDPENAALRNHIGELLFMRGDFDGAADNFRHAQSGSPDNPTACLWLAILAEQKGDFNQAVAELSKSGGLKEEAALNLRLSYYLSQANRIKEAVKVLEDAHKKWPDNDDVAYFLALGYDDLKQTDKAAELLRALLKARPDFRDARFQLGAIYEKHNRIEDAEREFRALVEQRPNDASALNYLGYSLTDRGLKLAEAEQFIRRAVDIDSSNGAYRDSLGWSHYKQGRFPQAVKELESAAALMPADATVWEHLGDAYEASGDKGKAWEAYALSESFERADRVRKKRQAAEAALAPGEVGRRSLDLAAAALKGLEMYGGPCEVSGSVGDKPFRFAGLLRYRSPQELELELLGPLFMPIWHMKLKGDDSFEMDPLHLEGVPAEAAQDAVYRGLRLIRDYLDGKLLAARPAEMRRGWRGDVIRTPDGDFQLQDARLARAFQAAGEPGLRLTMEYGAQLKNLPVMLRLEGRGFRLELKFPNPSARFGSEGRTSP